MAKNQVTCNACSNVFDVTTAPVREERLTEERIGLFFACPVCGAKYPFAAVSALGRKLKKQLDWNQRKIANCKTVASKEPLLDTRQLLLEQYKAEVTGPYKNEEVL